ncbi:hypothetical protein D3C80_1710640 [compost metagenome]
MGCAVGLQALLQGATLGLDGLQLAQGGRAGPVAFQGMRPMHLGQLLAVVVCLPQPGAAATDRQAQQQRQ